MRYLKQNTAVTIVIGDFIDWSDGKTLLRENDDLERDDILCVIYKGSTASTLTLTASGDNALNLTEDGAATLTLTAANIDTLGHFRLKFCNALSSGSETEYILPFIEDFSVLPANIYDSWFGSDLQQVDVISMDQDLQDELAETNSSILEPIFPANFTLMAIDGNGRLDMSKVNGTAISSSVAMMGVNVVTKSSSLDFTDIEAASLNYALFERGVNVYSTSITAIQSGLATSTELAALENLSSAEVLAEMASALATYDPPTKTELDSGLAALNDISTTDVNDQVALALSAYDIPTKDELNTGLATLNDISVSDIMSYTGVMPGETMTVGTLLKVITTWCAGRWQDKTGSAGIYEILDPDDGETAVMEVIPSTSSPHKQVTIL